MCVVVVVAAPLLLPRLPGEYVGECCQQRCVMCAVSVCVCESMCDVCVRTRLFV